MSEDKNLKAKPTPSKTNSSGSLCIIGIIPARYESKRFPGKPLALISGKSLLQRTYENALRAKRLESLFIATDDQRIADHALSFGAKAVMTSPLCPTGTDRLKEAVHTYFSDADIILNIQGDEPLLEPSVIDQVAELLLQDKEAVMSTAVVPIKTKEEAESRSVNKCVMDQKGNALYFSRGLIPHGHQGIWDKNTIYYKHLGLYGYRRDFLYTYAELSPTPLQLAEDLEQLKVLEHGYRIKVAVVASDSIGVDTPEDIKKVEQLYG